MAKWCTVAPLILPRGVPPSRAVNFARGLRLVLLPEWVTADNVLGALARPDRDAIKRWSTLAFVIEYEAHSLGDPDVEDATRSRQSIAEESIAMANLALWLAKPSALSYHVLFHFDRPGDSSSIRQAKPVARLRTLPCYENAEVVAEDYATAVGLHEMLLSLKRHGAVWTAGRSLLSAIGEYFVEMRFVLLWIGLEALFGPADAREITHRLAQRVGFFLGGDRSAARRIYDDVKTSYRWRSQVVHGSPSDAKMRMDRKIALAETTEALLRRALRKILDDKELVARFDGKERERFLNNLVFS